MRIGPARDVACSVNAGRARFEEFVHENAAIYCEASLFGERQTRPHTDARYHKSGLQRSTAPEDNALAFNTGHGILKMKLDPMLFMQPANEVAHFRP